MTSILLPRRLSVIPGGTGAESPAGGDWELLVAREARHQVLIEAAFDQVDACERDGDFEHALEWLNRANALGGGLPPAYEARQAQYAGELARRREPKVGPP